MAFVYSLISISLVFLFVFFYLKSSKISLFIFLISLYTNITLPPLFGLDIQVFKLQILFGLLIISIRLAQIDSYAKKLRLLSDYKLSRSIGVYFLFFSLSMLLFSRQYSFVGSLAMTIDYSLSYFVILPILIKQDNSKSFIDIILISTSFYVFIGILGYLLNDPLFGNFYYDETIINLRSSNFSYFEKIYRIDSYLKDNTFTMGINRIKFLSSDPNSLGTILSINIFLIVYKIYNSNKKVFWSIMFLVYLICLILTASRTLIIITIFGLLMMSIKKKFLLLLISILVYSTLQIIDIQSIITLSRFADISSTTDLIEANGRNVRWSYHLTNLSINNLLIGDGSTGFDGSFSQMSHNNYVGLIYQIGGLGFLAYCYSLFRTFSLIRININQIEKKYFYIIIISLLITGLTQETSSARGPATLLYCLFAYLSTNKNKIRKVEFIK